MLEVTVSETYSQDLLLLSVPNVRLEMGKRTFRFAAPAAWNLMQNDLGLRELVTLGEGVGGRCIRL